MKGLILCAGRGTRLRPFTHSRPKQLMPVGNRPVISFIIDRIEEAGIRDIGVVVAPEVKSQFEAVLSRLHPNTHMEMIEQRNALGLADAVKSARDFVGKEPFLLWLGDNFFTGSIDELLHRFTLDDADAVLSVAKVPDPERFGVAFFKDGRVTRLVEKPVNPESPYAVLGIYVLGPRVFDEIDRLVPSKRGEYELTDALSGLISHGGRVEVAITDAWWKDTGKVADLVDCNRKVLSNIRRQIHPDAQIEDSLIEGDVFIEAGAHISHSIVRGPTVIGAKAVIQHACVGPFTSIGEHAHVNGSEVENSILLEYARVVRVHPIIESSVVGAHVVVQEAGATREVLNLQLGDHSAVFI